MTIRLVFLAIVVLAFGSLSAIALANVGLWGIIQPHFRSWGGAQVFTDLVIMGLIAIYWMIRDARTHRVAAWPFVVLTLALGSFGPLLYLIVRELRTTSTSRQPARSHV